MNEQSSLDIHREYERARDSGDKGRADALFMAYLRACEREMNQKREITAQQAIRRAHA